MFSGFYIVAAALALDRVIGDPAWLPHPVIGIGRLIKWLERRWNRADSRPLVRRLFGVCLALLIPTFSGLIVWLLLHELSLVRGWLSAVIAIWLTATAIAWKGLLSAGIDVYRCLARGDLQAARDKVGRIVGRDTADLTEEEVVRAAVETLAENIVDAIVSPALFAAVGGAPWAWVYRAVNTLDSMVGYKNDRYRIFGWASARLDDVCNYLPARITALLLWVAVWLTGADAKNAWRIMRRDAGKHPSPNSGMAEAMVAGALGVRLGGYNSYGGVVSLRAYMGDATRPLVASDIKRVARLVSLVSWLLLVICAGAGVILSLT